MSSSQPAPLPALPAPRRGLGAFLSRPIVMVALMALIGIGALVSLGVVYLLSASKFTPTVAQKACLVTAGDVGTQFALTVEPSAESWKAQRYFDGAIDINYEYDDVSGSGIYVNSMISVSANESDAQFGFTGQWQGFKLGSNLAENPVDLEEANHVFQSSSGATSRTSPSSRPEGPASLTPSWAGREPRCSS